MTQSAAPLACDAKSPAFNPAPPDNHCVSLISRVFQPSISILQQSAHSAGRTDHKFITLVSNITPSGHMFDRPAHDALHPMESRSEGDVRFVWRAAGPIACLRVELLTVAKTSPRA
jgi:hypothetical protein